MAALGRVDLLTPSPATDVNMNDVIFQSMDTDPGGGVHHDPSFADLLRHDQQQQQQQQQHRASYGGGGGGGFEFSDQKFGGGGSVFAELQGITGGGGGHGGGGGGGTPAPDPVSRAKSPASELVRKYAARVLRSLVFSKEELGGRPRWGSAC